MMQCLTGNCVPIIVASHSPRLLVSTELARLSVLGAWQRAQSTSRAIRLCAGSRPPLAIAPPQCRTIIEAVLQMRSQISGLVHTSRKGSTRSHRFSPAASCCAGSPLGEPNPPASGGPSISTTLIRPASVPITNKRARTLNTKMMKKPVCTSLSAWASVPTLTLNKEGAHALLVAISEHER